MIEIELKAEGINNDCKTFLNCNHLLQKENSIKMLFSRNKIDKSVNQGHGQSLHLILQKQCSHHTT